MTRAVIAWLVVTGLVVGVARGAAVGGEAAAPVSRQELALAYQLFDREVAGRIATWTPDRRAEVSRSFDALTMLFFAAKLDEALATLNDLTASVIEEEQARQAATRELLGLRVAPVERWIPAEGPRRVTLRWLGAKGGSPFADPERQWSIEVRSLATHAGGDAGSSFTAPLAEVIEFGPARPGESGAYELSLHRRGVAFARPLGRVAVLPESPISIADRLTKRWAQVVSKAAGREADRAAFQTRLALLRAAGGEAAEATSAKGSQFLADLPRLASELAGELDAIERGESPWRRRAGDHWRTIRAGAIDAPCRVYVPERALAQGAARPALVIALHGAGGDENMFFDGYGAGLIKRLAEERGWVVVAPATTGFALTPIIFDAIVAEMGFVADIDPGRVHLVGHSMGAVAASSVTGLRGARIAGTALVAGVGASPKEAAPPILLIAGGLDPLFSASRLSASAEAWRERAGGASPIAFTVYPHDGHTMVMTAALPAIFEWFASLPPRSGAS